MAYKNYSKKDRSVKDAVAFESPQNIETNNYNQQVVKSFEKQKGKWRKLCSYFKSYPDRFLDFISPPDAKIKLYFYQRIYLRIMLRYRKVFLTATRGTSKSYLQNLAFVLMCIFYPRNKLFCCAPTKEQAAKITQDCLEDIFEHYPLLKNEVKMLTATKDYTKVVFFNGSRYDVVQMTEATRGGRRFGGSIEEIVDKHFNDDILNEVVIPLMANNRIAANGKVDPNEIHKHEVYITTSGTQQQFGYEKLKEIYADMLKGNSAFCMGNSYELPCMFGQLDIDFIEEKRESPTYSTMSFMREYESFWTGSSSDSLVSDEKIKKCRLVGIAEWEHCGDSKAEYVLSYDVAREEGDENALCALSVIKITPRSDGSYVKELVNIFSSEGMHDTYQAKYLKEKVNEFKAKILIIDANGIGSGVVDQLVLDLDDGNPPYSVVNDDKFDKFDKFKTPDSIPILFALKSQQTETKNTDMINHFMKIFNKLDIGLLKYSHEGIKDLQKKMGKKFKESEDIARFELPYVMTDILCEEIMNLKYKQSGNITKVERVSTRIQKDKYSSLLYGLYWIYLEEMKNRETKKRGKFDLSKYIAFN